MGEYRLSQPAKGVVHGKKGKKKEKDKRGGQTWLKKTHQRNNLVRGQDRETRFQIKTGTGPKKVVI